VTQDRWFWFADPILEYVEHGDTFSPMSISPITDGTVDAATLPTLVEPYSRMVTGTPNNYDYDAVLIGGRVVSSRDAGLLQVVADPGSPVVSLTFAPKTSGHTTDSVGPVSCPGR
jgi:hypothetical protein